MHTGSDELPPSPRADPRPDAFPGQGLLYGAIQGAWSAAARRRYRARFDRVETVCLFVGYPRSGHSVVGAMLNAHRHAVISHELDALRLVAAGCDRDTLYSRILARAAWFNLRGNRSNYRYQVPGQWQGRFERLRVIGDKGGGWVAQHLARRPDLMARVRSLCCAPVRVIHIVRNPFDNIAAISRWHRLSIDEAIDFYFAHCAVTVRLGSIPGIDEARTLRHEQMLRAPGPALADLCEFLGLEPDDAYLSACASIVFRTPTRPRQRVEWRPEQVRDVQRRARPYEFLRDYAFQPQDTPSAEAPRPGTETATSHPGSKPPRGESFTRRLGSFLAPHRPPR